MATIKKEKTPKREIIKESAKEQPTDLYIVGIGASAGGLEAINSFFDHMPIIENVSFVLIQHLSPDYKSLMPQLLEKHTSLAIHTAEHEMVVKPKAIYIIPPKTSLTIKEGKLFIAEREKPKTLHLPINIFFRSLADDQQSKSIGVILSGTGSDGTLGIEAIKQYDGLVIVQNEASAAFESMPRNAVLTGMVDIIADPAEMGSYVKDYINNPQHFSKIVVGVGLENNNVKVRQQILDLVYKHSFVDFSSYKKNTITRRLERRVNALGFSTEEDYLKYILKHPDEITVLYNDFLIGVTSFFRDNDAFEFLENEVILGLINNTSADKSIRIWVIGCSTGEEAYSIAIMLREVMAKNKLHRSVKIFATDIDQRAISTGSKGVFDKKIEETVSEERLVQNFIKNKGGYEIKNEVREMIVFAKHDIIKDPPFNLIDMVCCRNMMIYLENRLQEKVISHIRFSLRKGGILFLGSSETPGVAIKHFETIHQKNKIYRNKSEAKITDVSRFHSESKKGEERGREPVRVFNQAHFLNNLKEAILADDVMPTAVINDNCEVIHVSGEVETFLRFPKKQFSLHILKMVDEDLYVPISNIIQRVKKENKKVTYHNIKWKREEGNLMLSIVARPFNDVSEGKKCFIIRFESQNEVFTDASTGSNQLDQDQKVHIRLLEDELKETKEYLQSTIEELETSNEELQATNEELIAANEELQSSNEELQSLNEELYTVNNEFQNKIEELAQVNDDLNNLVQRTKVGTLFLDESFNIRKFTKEATKEFSFTESDLDRPIKSFTHDFQDLDIVENCQQVLRDLQLKEIEVSTNKGDHYLMQFLPYRTQKDTIEGVIITFVNINRLKNAESLLKMRTEELQRSNKELEQFAYVASHDLQEPLRTVTGFTELLANKYANHFDKTGQKSLKFIVDATRRMSQLIKGLLDYSRLGREKDLQLVDCNEIIEDIKSDLDSNIKETGTNIIVEPLPTVKGYDTELRVLFQNLITNAIKFRKKNVIPIVNISAVQENGFWKFAIKDNGIGVAKEHKSRIFVIFQRLHTTNEYEGTGIGLAHCRKIVDLHGGNIWVDSEQNKGSTFYFTLPK